MHQALANYNWINIQNSDRRHKKLDIPTYNKVSQTGFHDANAFGKNKSLTKKIKYVICLCCAASSFSRLMSLCEQFHTTIEKG